MSAVPTQVPIVLFDYTFYSPTTRGRKRKASASSFENTNYTNGIEDEKGSSIQGSLVCKYRSAFKTNELTY